MYSTLSTFNTTTAPRAPQHKWLPTAPGRGAVKGGKVRTILRAHDGRGPPEGETWFLPRGTLEPCISARPRPGFDRANFHVIMQTFRLLDIHQLVMKKLPRWWKQHETVLPWLSRASLCLVSSSSREPSAQLKSSASNTRNKACHKPQQK